METCLASPVQARVGDAYSAQCPCRLILDRVADKWTALIVGRLADGPLRFNQLKRLVEGISQKVLTQTLRALERDGLVSRAVFPTVPTTVVYELTALGRSLIEPLAMIRQWAEVHLDAVSSAQTEYDARQLAPGPLV